MTFVVKGLSEVYDPRGGYPLPFKDALVTGEAVYAGADAKIPAAGSEIKRVTEIAAAAGEGPGSSRPDARCSVADRELGLAVERLRTGAERSSNARSPSSRKRVTELQDAMTKGDIDLRRHHARVPGAAVALRSPRPDVPLRAVDQPARDRRCARARCRTRGRHGVRGPFHGVPIVFKDNIDAIELPTTGGSLALVDHRPRLDSRVAAGMKRGGAVVLGKANLDEFPFGDFGISTVGGTVGNAYDPSLSTSGSSGGSATAVAASLAALGFGTDTCNSLSNPAALRVAGHHPHDARADEPRRRDAAQYLQRRGRTDGEIGSRRRARARSRHRPGCRRSRHGRCRRNTSPDRSPPASTRRR